MKKIILLFILFFLLTFKAYSIEEIVPDFADIEENEQKPLIEKIFGQKELNFENSFVNKIKYGVSYKGTLDFTHYDKDGSFGTAYPFSIEPYIHSYFGESKNELRFAFLPSKKVDNYDSKIAAMITDFYYIRHLNDNHQVLIGHSRVPVGFEGGMGLYDLPFVERSQIGSKFGNSRALGIKFQGNIKKFEYNLGVYSSTRYLQHLNDGGEFVGWLGYKPFQDKDTPLKNLKLGGGLNYGRQGENYTVLSTGATWDYKKTFASIEYGYAQNYNGANGFKEGKAQGANATVGYNLTDKLQILGRYDIFSPDIDKSDNYIAQYTAGINYFVLKQRLRFTLNYIFEQQKDNNKNMVMFLTQFMI